MSPETETHDTAPSLYETLAAIEHQRWSDWQKYVHSLCVRQDDGSLVIPAELVAQWERQIETPYADLTETEKDSDREQVDRYWHLVSNDDGVSAESDDRSAGGEPMDEVTAAVARTKGGSVSSEAREKAKQAGHAMKDGSFPIEDAADLDNAIQSVGRAKDPEAARRHIIKQAKRLGLESRIPDSWNADGSVKESVSASAGEADNGTICTCQIQFAESAASHSPEQPGLQTGQPQIWDSAGSTMSRNLAPALSLDTPAEAVVPKSHGHPAGTLTTQYATPASLTASDSGTGSTITNTKQFPSSELENGMRHTGMTHECAGRGTQRTVADDSGTESPGMRCRPSYETSTADVQYVDSSLTHERLTGKTARPISITTMPGSVSASGSAPTATRVSAGSMTTRPTSMPQHGTLNVTDPPPIEWFRDPTLTEPTPLSVSADGRVAGHLALWDSDHIGFPGQSIRPPRSRSDYAYFHTGSRKTVGDSSEEVIVATGHITLDTGHADMGSDFRAASAHYDDTGTLVADVCAGEDTHGIWIAGALVPGVDEIRLHKLRACGLSGDWRRIGSGLELVAALSVPTPGFPVPRSRVASGEPMALVAAGALPPPPEPLTVEAIAAAVVTEQRRRSELDEKRTALLDDLDDAEDRMVELLIQVYADEIDWDGLADDDALSADAMPLSRMPPQLQKSYLSGKVAARIKWNTPRDWTRCRAQAIKHGMTPHQAAGACNWLHKAATGVYPGDKRNV